MAGDMEDAAMAPRKRVYMYNPLASFSAHIDDYVAESLSYTVVVPDVRIQILPTIVSHVGMQDCSNSPTHIVQDNYEAFICIVWEWSFIRLLKPAGIRNNAGRWKVVEPVSCAVDCLACPCPGVNIPVKVDPDLPDAREHTLFVGVDANFKLERFEVSSEEKDPGLGSGLGYFVDTTSFKNHLKMFDKHILQAQSTCKDHKAAKPDKKTCAQLQVEMDYGYLTAVRRFNGVPCIVTLYDIACQWSINLEDRIKIYSLDMAPPLCCKLYLVPKFHLPGHIKNCQEKFSPEWSWAISNGVVASTWEMSPGHRCEKLDQHFGDINWQNNVSMGDSLLRKIKDAVPNAAEYESRFERFTKTLPSEEIAKWTAMVEACEADREEPNPFARTGASKSEAAMRLQLAREDAQDELAGLDGDQLFVTSPKDMVAQDVGSLESTRSWASIPQTCNEPKIESWFIQQEAHMPVVCGLRARDNLGNGPSVPTYLQQLYLPSSILLMDHPCGDILICAEAHLHIGQGFDLLHTIHGHLLALAKAYKDGDTTTLMQKEWLKCHKTTRDISVCITQAKNYYRHVWQCLMTLSTRSGDCTWQSQLQVLEESDVHRISDNAVGAFDNEQGMSCIWYTSHLGDVPGGVNEYLRIEWCKACARAHHWREECINAGEGAGAYARCQAAIHTTIKAGFEWKWRYVEEWLSLGDTENGSIIVDINNPFV
ncbi:hypothetical protein IW261DRAFT_1427079 [Armillaria novae-zelandiae]|uniref:CxC2-like cysteine cluster KDZ transposase-associated domain-containing protein n=1 Tax=Armillaria novae-zelandiae TaxID=153914 RepID=A0AA39NHX1_9AGAR|nr:hypothetical protein IW261DRAFT_1427079 [Armillaria novae-zelandiae]